MHRNRDGRDGRGRLAARRTLWRLVRVAVVVFLALSAPTAHASLVRRATLTDLAASAQRIFRGSCISAITSQREIAGANVVTTTYTFRVDDGLKGIDEGEIVFRQVGAPGGGARDLGSLVGLPTYRPGNDYVLFLLPESKAGMTSPAGAARGAFRIVSERVVSGAGLAVPGAGRTEAAAPTTETTSDAVPYSEFRRLIVEALGHNAKEPH
jgi:hypothetical protein